MCSSPRESIALRNSFVSAIENTAFSVTGLKDVLLLPALTFVPQTGFRVKALEPLSENIIKHLHLLLKQGTKDSSLDWFAVGDYKKRANTVGGRETCKPSEVHKAMDKLVTNFNSKCDITIDDIIELHADFEYIHPFQDGNGRVGRLIALKECLRFNIIPFIIEDSKKSFYYRGLANWNQEKGWLRDICLDDQDTFKRILKVLDIHE